MPDHEVPVGKVIETLKSIKSHYKQMSVTELVKVRRYVNAAWDQIEPSYKHGGYKNLAEREALQLVIDLQMELKTELDARMAAAAVTA